MDWAGKVVLITGGTGSFGQAFARLLLRTEPVAAVRILSRDELKQSEMRRRLSDRRLEFMIGDVRDKDRLYRAFNGVHLVVHAAALKQVPACEYNPIEAVKTNILGAANVIDAAIDRGVDRVMALSTDKAANPVNLYGATKLCAEKLFVQANAYAGSTVTRFGCVRYGNVVASRGSLVPLLEEQRAAGRITLTDPRMTRFWVTLGSAVAFVKKSLEEIRGGEVFIPKMPSIKTVDLIEAIAPGCRVDVIGVRAGEKIHEVLVTIDESRHTADRGSSFVIEPEHPWWVGGPPAVGITSGVEFLYSSDTNDEWLSVEQVRAALPEAMREAAHEFEEPLPSGTAG